MTAQDKHRKMMNVDAFQEEIESDNTEIIVESRPNKRIKDHKIK